MPFRLRCCRHRLAAALACAVLAASTHAASLQVVPTTLSLTAERRAEGLTLRNTGSETVHAQVRVFSWIQVEGEDRLQPASGLVASPPMLELAPGAEQLIRVVRTGPLPTVEEAFRVIVDELPLDRNDDGQRPGLRLVLRYSIPVFVVPQAGPGLAPLLRTRLSGEPKQRHLEIENLGNGHAQIADLEHAALDGRAHAIAPGLSGYVLPGQRRRWRLPADLALENGTFRARINGEPDPRALELAR